MKEDHLQIQSAFLKSGSFIEGIYQHLTSLRRRVKAFESFNDGIYFVTSVHVVVSLSLLLRAIVSLEKTPSNKWSFEGLHYYASRFENN